MRALRSSLLVAFLIYLTLDLLTPFVPGIVVPVVEDDAEAILPNRVVAPETSNAAPTVRHGPASSAAPGKDLVRMPPRRARLAVRDDRLLAALPRRDCCAHDTDPIEDSSISLRPHGLA
jgi:hypothetical protein